MCAVCVVQVDPVEEDLLGLSKTGRLLITRGLPRLALSHTGLPSLTFTIHALKIVF